MAYTAVYTSTNIAEVIIDIIVSIASGMTAQTYLAGGAIILTVAIGLYLGLFNKFMAWIRSFVGGAKKI